MDTDGVSERRRATRASNFKVSNLEEILPGAKIIPPVNQVCRDHSTGEDYPMLRLHPSVWNAAQPVAEVCEKHGIKLHPRAVRRQLLVFRMVHWRMLFPRFELDSRTDAWRSRNCRPGSIKVGTAEGRDSDNVRHLLIWLMGDDWHSK